MSDDQLSWKKLLADEASKAEAKVRGRTKSTRTAVVEKEIEKKTTEVSFAKMDWSPLHKPAEPKADKKLEPTATTVRVKEETIRVKVEKTPVENLEPREEEEPQVFSVYDLN